MTAVVASPTDDPKRRRILDAALSVGARSGISAARMEEVASEAGVSKGTLYRFFQSKEDLFLATLIDSYETGVRHVDARLPDESEPETRLRAVLEGLVEVLERVGPRATLHYQAWGMVAANPELNERLHGFLRAFHADRFDEFASLVVDGQAAGRFRSDVDAATTAHAIGSLLSGFIYRSAFDPDAATPDALRRCFDDLVGGLIAGSAPDPDSTPARPPEVPPT